MCVSKEQYSFPTYRELVTLDAGCTGSGCTGSGCTGTGCTGSGCTASGCTGTHSVNVYTEISKNRCCFWVGFFKRTQM